MECPHPVTARLFTFVAMPGRPPRRALVEDVALVLTAVLLALLLAVFVV